MSNLLAQYIGVAIALIVAVGWIVRRIIRRRKGSNGDCTESSGCCCGCALSDNCRKKDKGGR